MTSDELKTIIPVTYGENLPFIDSSGSPCKTLTAEKKNKKRLLTVKIRTWVGSMAFNAVHYYISISTGRVWTHVEKAHPNKHISITGWGDKKPKEAQGLDIDVVRPTTERDINHWMMTHDEEPKIIDLLCPKMGSCENGFWEKGDAIIAAREVLHKYFIVDDWAIILDDPDDEPRPFPL